uniref:DUF3778 domain-containing protein n=2 Tax=Oryza sativa subsp. japonica TaxID=39947 RepID=Q6ZLL8_ORYSJ|nr:hypothetical protein [Oryza sativa Japonica Group]
MVGGSGGARSEDLWANRRLELAPGGGVGSVVILGWESHLRRLLLSLTSSMMVLVLGGLVEEAMFGVLEAAVDGCMLLPDSCRLLMQTSSSPANFVVSARQEDLCSHYNARMMKVDWSLVQSSLLCLISRNHAEFVIRVELGPHARFRSTGFLLEFLRFNDELRGDPLLCPVKLTPISTAQHHTSVLCCFCGGSRDGDYRFVKRFARLMRL